MKLIKSPDFWADSVLKLFVLLLLCYQYSDAFAQKQYNVWYFGNKAGLTFNTNPPQALIDGALSTYEGCSGICDDQGNLLFYTNGDLVYNKQHQLMKNGTLFPPGTKSSSIQAALVLPVPLHADWYYLFTPSENEHFTQEHFLRYSIIDMKGDLGKGAVISANNPLLPYSLEKMAITRHSNGVDYWIATINQQTGDLNSVRTVNGLIDTNVLRQKVFSPFPNMSNMKFSPDGNILETGFTWNSPTTTVLYLHRFDKSTGKISAPLIIASDHSFSWSTEFSPNSRFLYHSLGYALFQFDLSVWDSNAVASSAVWLNASNLSPLIGLQLGPDGKIYHFSTYDTALSVILAPNLAGLSCGYRQDIIPLKGRKVAGGAPYYPTFLFNFYPDLGNDTILCTGDTLMLHCSGTLGSIHWSTGDTTEQIIVRSPGIYRVSVYNGTSVMTDSIEIKYRDKFRVYLGNDTTFCKDFSYLLNAGKGARAYQWNTGDTTVSILASQPGIYAVTVKDSNSCPAGDTILLNRVWSPQFSVDPDTILCEYVYLRAQPVHVEMKYLWSTGDTLPQTRVSRKGTYTLTVSSPFCSVAGAIDVDELPVPDPGLEDDTVFCDLPQIILRSKEGSRFLWSTGETTGSITVTQPGIYSVTAFNGVCKASDTIRVDDSCYTRYYLPNAFTPSGDGLNEVFKVYGSSIDWITMKVYNRWGEQVFESSGKDPSWNGTYRDSLCQPDVYVYVITVSGQWKGAAREQTISGNVTLVR